MAPSSSASASARYVGVDPRIVMATTRSDPLTGSTTGVPVIPSGWIVPQGWPSATGAALAGIGAPTLTLQIRAPVPASSADTSFVSVTTRRASLPCTPASTKSGCANTFPVTFAAKPCTA